MAAYKEDPEAASFKNYVNTITLLGKACRSLGHIHGYLCNQSQGIKYPIDSIFCQRLKSERWVLSY